MNNEKIDEVVQLYLDDIIPNRYQPREIFDERALKELAVSIREHGVIQPIIVRKRNANGKYEIIAGERRYKASALAGLTKIPAIIRNLDDKESSKVALLENLQRKDLNPIEEARTYQKILEIDQMTQAELAKTMGKSQSSVANKLRLLTLPDEIQDALLKEQISERHARGLLNIPDVEKQKEMLKKIISTKMSVRSLEEEIKKIVESTGKSETNEPTATDKPISFEQSFLIDSPLKPNKEVEIPENNYGKITISPPVEEGNNMPEYINFGEVNAAEELTNETPSQLNFDSSVKPIDITDVRNNTNDLNIDKSQEGGLDSLLNINRSYNQPLADGDGFASITPADVVTENNYSINVNNDSNYDNTVVENNAPILSEKNSESKYTIDMAKAKIKEVIEELRNSGLDIKFDEMNFDKFYQIIIKLNKSEE